MIQAGRRFAVGVASDDGEAAHEAKSGEFASGEA